jgi:hypothetical protein
LSQSTADILDAVAFLRAVRCEGERVRLKCHAHAERLEHAVIVFETLLLLESLMRNINDLIPLVVADVTKLRADNASLATENADLKAKLAAGEAATATPENLQALEALEPEPAAVDVAK